ncbi:MAG: hypothetical protein KKB70_08335 [Proteobacteria bacterium]|nr:hypothetical protein [Pseudomonadota bacterium]
MSKITKFSNSDFPGLRKEINDALALIGGKHGITFSLGNISFNPESWSTKLTCVVATLDGNGDTLSAKETKAKQDWNHYAKLGVVPEGLVGKTFVSRSKKYVVMGYLPRCTRFPILCKCLADGTSTKFTRDILKKVAEPGN